MEVLLVTIISATIQEFNGKRYWLCGKYFQRALRKEPMSRLHRVVWEYHNGPIPDGHDIHHADENRSHNQLSNLECKLKAKHISDHFKGVAKVFPAGALDAAAEWHGSEAGREWHRKHHEQFKEQFHQQAEYICEFCGKVFTTTKKNTNRFCSGYCKHRSRLASGIDDEKRICVVCGNEFVVNRYIAKTCCSRKCRGTLSGNVRRKK